MNAVIVPEEHMKILRLYLDSPGTVLIPESFAREHNITEDDIDLMDEYNFGGEADIELDIVSSPEHYWMICLNEYREDAKQYT